MTTMEEGYYRIKTTALAASAQPAGYSLSAGYIYRSSVSGWASIEKGKEETVWHVTPGRATGTWRIETSKPYAFAKAKWALSAWGAWDGKRSDSSSKVALHEGNYWTMDWTIKPGKRVGTWLVLTTKHTPCLQAGGWALTAWPGTNQAFVHAEHKWAIEWAFEKDIPGRLHQGEDCWYECGGKGGSCAWC